MNMATFIVGAVTDGLYEHPLHSFFLLQRVCVLRNGFFLMMNLTVFLCGIHNNRPEHNKSINLHDIL